MDHQELTERIKKVRDGFERLAPEALPAVYAVERDIENIERRRKKRGEGMRKIIPFPLNTRGATG